MKTHSQALSAAQAAGKIIKRYSCGSFSVRSPEKTVATVYKPDGTEYRINVTESLETLFSYEYPRK